MRIYSVGVAAGFHACLVWQQKRRFEDCAATDFALRQDFGRLLDQQPDNVQILKMNYWLGL